MSETKGQAAKIASLIGGKQSADSRNSHRYERHPLTTVRPYGSASRPAELDIFPVPPDGTAALWSQGRRGAVSQHSLDEVQHDGGTDGIAGPVAVLGRQRQCVVQKAQTEG